jgi:hypothetical protein
VKAAFPKLNIFVLPDIIAYTSARIVLCLPILLHILPNIIAYTFRLHSLVLPFR